MTTPREWTIDLFLDVEGHVEAKFRRAVDEAVFEEREAIAAMVRAAVLDGKPLPGRDGLALNIIERGRTR